MSKKDATAGQILRFFWQASLQHKRNLILSSLVPIGAILLSTALPYYIGQILAALGSNASEATRFIPHLIAVGILGGLANRFGFINLLDLQAKTHSFLQTTTLEALLRQSTGFHNNRVAGKLVSDAIDLPAAYGQLASTFFVNIIPFSAIVMSGVTLVMFKSWQLGLLLLGMTIVIVGTSIWQSRVRTPLRRKRLAATKAVTAHLADAIVNNHTVKTFAQEKYELQEHHALNTKLLLRRQHDWKLAAKDGSNRIFALLLFQVLFALLIIKIVQRDPAMLAIGIFSFSYFITVTNNMFTMNIMIRTLEDAFLNASPMMEIINHTPDLLDDPDSKPFKAKKGDIEIKDIRFAYKDSTSNESIFDGLSLRIPAGQKVGLVGPSGGGKSTLTRLLLRFDDIQAGSISIDGQNIAKVTQASLRQHIAYVPQEPLLFHRSVRENIAYAHPDISLDAVIAAAKQANAHEFIEKLPDGYDTLVGERGVKLSGGQRQRIAIARAIIKNAPILILDEATSALDSESEALIQEALQRLMRHKTSLVIAHRLSTIQKMDNIVVIQDGDVIEQGTHQKLLRKSNGLYAKLWVHQSGGFIEE